MIHRDLKPENVLIGDDGRLLIADFGLAVCSGGKWQNEVCGTLSYMAPEVISGRSYSCAVDMWSLGVMVYEFLTGGVPFDHAETQVLEKMILTKDMEPLPPSVSSDASHFVHIVREQLHHVPGHAGGSGMLTGCVY